MWGALQAADVRIPFPQDIAAAQALLYCKGLLCISFKDLEVSISVNLPNTCGRGKGCVTCNNDEQQDMMHRACASDKVFVPYERGHVLHNEIVPIVQSLGLLSKV